MAKEIKGIDVSKYQGSIDFNKVKASGINFVMIRLGSGYGGKFCLDPKFKTYYTAAKAAKLNVGCYFYTYAKTVARATAEAKEVLAALKGYTFEYPVAFDIEDPSIYNNAGCTKAVVTAMIKAWCSTVEKAGYYVSLYSNPNWLKTKIDNALLKKYDLWLAHWDAKQPSYPCGLWQYTSNGAVNGIRGRVDMDISYKNYPGIIKKAGLNGFPKAVNKYTPTAKPTKPAATTGTIKAGTKITLKNAELYTAYTANKAARRITGTYYIYDGVKKYGKYRITNKPSNVNKAPAFLRVTGYVREDQIKNA